MNEEEVAFLFGAMEEESGEEEAETGEKDSEAA